MTQTELHSSIRKNQQAVLADWVEVQIIALGSRTTKQEVMKECEEFLSYFLNALERTGGETLHGSEWEAAKRFLTDLSRTRSQQGYSPSETATFVFSLKRPLFNLIRREHGNQPEKLAEKTWTVTSLVDQLGLLTMEAYQKSRDELILRQQEELLELSTPVVKLWEGVLALPMIGTLDSSRTQVVMENLLQRIMETDSEIAIIDITGVPTVDTLVAQHLIKTVTAARLMGAECIISGIRPQIAATIVHLGVDLSGVTTKATLADAFLIALNRLGKRVVVSSQPAKMGLPISKEARA